MACHRYWVVRLGSPCTRAMGGGFIHIVRASVRTAAPTHASCTEDAMAEQSQVREGLCEIRLRYRSFVSHHAPHVCEMRQSQLRCCKRGDARQIYHLPVTPANIRARFQQEAATRPRSATSAYQSVMLGAAKARHVAT